MAHKALPKREMPNLIDSWREHAAVVGPVHVGDLVEFQRLTSSSDAALESMTNSRVPPKALFLPQSEVMFRATGNDLVSTSDEVSPRVVLAIRPCDARALQLLDTVLLADPQDPYWAGRREATTIVALGCDDPCETCFCTTVGSGPFDSRGADALLTKLGDTYVAEVLTEKGQALLTDLPDASQQQVEETGAVQASAANRMKRPFQPTGIKEKLNSLFESDFWREVQQSCLGCGVCTFLCPTCFCFDIVDEAQRRERVRNWDTCMFRLYSQEASGHNPRPTNIHRTRQRIMHKYAYWLELIKEIGCTGCGRCVRYCPVDLDIRHIVSRAQACEED